jgi:hypothetical protein
MRTTLTLDDDVYQAVATLSQTSGLSLGKVLSKVARQGLKPKPIKKKKNGFPTFDVPKDAPMISVYIYPPTWHWKTQRT